MIIDLHVHEWLHSPCALMSLEDAVESAQYHGLDGICITDHDSMEIQNSAAASGSRRVLRGGSWDGLDCHCRSANRWRYPPGYGCITIGFRLALSPA